MPGPEHRLQLRVKKFVTSAVTAPHRFACHDRSQNSYGGGPMGRHFWERQRGIKAGEPDTELTVNGMTIKVELKAPGGKLSEAQIREGALIRAAGGIWGVAYSVTEYGNFLSEHHVPLALNWAIQAAHHDAMLEAAALKKPAPKKSKAKPAKPSTGKIRRTESLRAKFPF